VLEDSNNVITYRAFDSGAKYSMRRKEKGISITRGIQFHIVAVIAGGIPDAQRYAIYYPRTPTSYYYIQSFSSRVVV